MTRTTGAFIVMLVAIGIAGAGCRTTPDFNLRERLDRFREVLPEDIRADFDAGDYAACADSIEALLVRDEEFTARFDEVKHAEAIDIFTVEEVVDFYRRYFVDKLKEEKKFRW